MSTTLAILAFITLGSGAGGYFLVRKIKEAFSEETARKSAEKQLQAKHREAKIHAAPRRRKPDIIERMREYSGK